MRAKILVTLWWTCGRAAEREEERAGKRGSHGTLHGSSELTSMQVFCSTPDDLQRSTYSTDGPGKCREGARKEQ